MSFSTTQDWYEYDHLEPFISFSMSWSCAFYMLFKSPVTFFSTSTRTHIFVWHKVNTQQCEIGCHSQIIHPWGKVRFLCPAMLAQRCISTPSRLIDDFLRPGPLRTWWKMAKRERARFVNVDAQKLGGLSARDPRILCRRRRRYPHKREDVH